MKVVKGLSSAVLLTLLLGSASAVYADEVQEYALDTIDIVNIGLHFFHKDVRLMLPLVVKHSIVAA